MQHVLALSGCAVVLRHWFEIDLDDASMEHGARVELRLLAARPHRGSESAAQLSGLAEVVAGMARRFGPDRCGSASECFALTRDALESVQLMIEYLRRPDLLDVDWVAPWATAT